MIGKPPKSKQQLIVKRKSIQNECEDNDDKENSLPKQSKPNGPRRSFGKDITNQNLNNDLGMVPIKRNSFSKELSKDKNLQFKKNSSTSSINRSNNTKKGSNENINIYTSAEGNHLQSKQTNYSIEKKAIGKIAYQKVLSVRNSTGCPTGLKNSNLVQSCSNGNIGNVNSVGKKPTSNVLLSNCQSKEILLLNHNKHQIHYDDTKLENDKEGNKPHNNPTHINRMSGTVIIPPSINIEVIEMNTANKFPIPIASPTNLEIVPEVREINTTRPNNDHADKDSEMTYFNGLPKNNPQIPYEYVNTIYHNLLTEEMEMISTQKASIDYMKNQKEINEQMRSILVDWLIDVHLKFGFTDETLYITVDIIDRYLTIQSVSRTKLQLLGITALMIACKHEEIDLPKVKDFIYITDNAYSREEVFQMEYDVLAKLHFDFLAASPIKFYEIMSTGFNFTNRQLMMGKYLMESFLVDMKKIKYKSSVIACACAYIVMKFFKMPNYASSYDKKYFTASDQEVVTYGVKECAKDICLFVDNINKTNFTATMKKFSKSEYEKVAQLIGEK